MVRVEHVLESWRAIRQDTVEAVRDFPAAELDFRPAPELMTFRETARHILDAGDGLAAMLLAGEESFVGPDFRDRLVKHMRTVPADASIDDIVAALASSVRDRTAALAEQPAGFWSHIITRFDGVPVTRLEMLQTIKEHELTHRAQLFFCLRLKSIVPSTTRRRLAKQAAG